VIAARELAKYTFNSEGVKEIRNDKGSTEPAEDYIFLY
jgi:hypothetical protein